MCIAYPGRILHITNDPSADDPLTALVLYGDDDGVKQTVSLALVPQARVGEYLLVHTGIAIGVMDEAAALEYWYNHFQQSLLKEEFDDTQLTNLRDPDMITFLISEIKQVCTRKWRVMEICGGQTKKIRDYGLDILLNDCVEFVSGPGCPACVTPANKIDLAIDLACRSGVVVAAFGDVFRLQGSHGMSIERAVAERNAQVLMVESAQDALTYAIEHPSLEVVYFAIGFETTTAPNALALLKAIKVGIKNFSMLVTQVTVPAAIHALYSDPEFHVDGFLGAGHVCTTMGSWQYPPIAEQYKVPIIITGFEPVDLLVGVYQCVRMLEANLYGVENAYARVVKEAGNYTSQTIIDKVFTLADCEWNGFDMIPMSGNVIRSEYAFFDAVHRFELKVGESVADVRCPLNAIYRGAMRADECPYLLDVTCTPEHSIGNGMHGEGPCGPAYTRFILQQESAQKLCKETE